MQRLGGVNHVTFITHDMDRLVTFYEEVFEAHKLMELPVPQLNGRHALIDVGGGTVLHPFEIPGSGQPGPGQPMFGRGRLDHFALQAPDNETFESLRERLVARGVSDGAITDFGVMRVLTFMDPDGLDVEIAHWVGGTDPAEIDMARATDEALFRGRADAAAKL
jgi:catechol 2,3-dioxygenase-like lactoylglutathione lyase family enzyme